MKKEIRSLCIKLRCARPTDQRNLEMDALELLEQLYVHWSPKKCFEILFADKEFAKFTPGAEFQALRKKMYPDAFTKEKVELSSSSHALFVNSKKFDYKKLDYMFQVVLPCLKKATDSLVGQRVPAKEAEIRVQLNRLKAEINRIVPTREGFVRFDAIQQEIKKLFDRLPKDSRMYAPLAELFPPEPANKNKPAAA